ncbi:helix-turn-helix domain-containing protein [Nitrospira sp. Kam-Ns4a]
MSTPAYLDLRALAAYASCSVRWLRARLADAAHPLPHYRIGRKLLVKREEFDVWIARYRVCRRGEDLDQLVDQVVAAVCARTAGR